MNKMIKIDYAELQSSLVQAINARDLYKFLGSRYQFSDWINLFLLDFEVGVDYLVSQKKLKNPAGGRPITEYTISVDMAKHIALMSRTEKGKEIRKYFIECEQALKSYTLKSQQWLQARADSKQVRRKETDMIKAFVEYATAQGSMHASRYYMAITKGIYSALYILEKGAKWEAIREDLGTTDLQVLSTCEHVAQKYIKEGMDLTMQYKDIYKYAISKVEEMASIIGKKEAGNKLAYTESHQEASSMKVSYSLRDR